MRQKILSYLGFATKSRNLINGYNTCVAAMSKRKIKLLIMAEDVSDNTAKKLLGEAIKNKVEYRVYGKIDELSQITGNENVGILGITEENFAKVILEEIDKSQSYEKEVF